jgi:hypothetical protein
MYEIWENDEWVNYWKYTYTYADNNNRLLSRLHEEWKNGEWVNYWKHTYTYDDNELDRLKRDFDLLNLFGK